MADCFFCPNPIKIKEGTSKIWVPIDDDDVAVVEVDSPYYCFYCKEHYLTTNQLISGFSQIKEELGGKKAAIKKGIYH